jgi:hypothetical protein
MAHTQHYINLLAFPLRGENAAGKFAIACLVVTAGYLIPVLPWIFFLGYVYQIMTEVTSGGTARMPVWIEWGRLFRNGLKLFGLTSIYTLPVNLVFFGGFFAYFLAMFAFALAAENAPNSAASLMFAIIPLIFFLVMAVGYLLLLITGLIVPPAAGNMAAKDRFSAGFDFKSMLRVVRANSGGYLIAFLLVLGLLSLILFVSQIIYMTLIFCFFLPFILLILYTYLVLMSAALFADAYRSGMEKLA